MSKPINFESLLRRYIEHVQCLEGADYVRDMYAPEFTAEEISFMRGAAEESWQKRHS